MIWQSCRKSSKNSLTNSSSFRQVRQAFWTRYGVNADHHIELTSTVQARQKLESQQQENKNVQAEFSLLKDDANIYKLVGPVLLKQDKTEAVLAVDSRLQYIEKEIERVEKQIAEIQEKSEKKKKEVCFDWFRRFTLELMVYLSSQIYTLQTQMQQGQQARVTAS